jgi:diacylglycerol kinase (ATP)
MVTPPLPTPADDGVKTGDSVCAYKGGTGLGRLLRACRYSWAGLRAAFRHEAAFRQEVAIGLPAVVFAWWWAPGRWEALAMSAAVLLVWVVELLNSAVEAVADAVSTQHHPLLGRAKDLGSAAVMISLILAAAVWVVALWPD